MKCFDKQERECIYERENEGTTVQVPAAYHTYCYTQKARSIHAKRWKHFIQVIILIVQIQDIYNDIDLFASKFENSNAALKHCSSLLSLDLTNFQHIFIQFVIFFNNKREVVNHNRTKISKCNLKCVAFTLKYLNYGDKNGYK